MKTSPCLDSVIIYQNQHVDLTLNLCFSHHLYIYIYISSAIETKLASGYANLLLYIFQRDMSDLYPNKPSIWLRYIDEIFMIWNESEDKLKDFLAYIVSVNLAIQLTHASSYKSVNLQDVLVNLTDDRTISTDVCTKPTYTHQYLRMNVAILITLRKLLRFRRRHGFFASAVTQQQRRLGVLN